jgi:hypothetical protein
MENVHDVLHAQQHVSSGNGYASMLRKDAHI